MWFSIEFWYTVIIILPDSLFSPRSSWVSAVNCPISAGIAPTKITRLVFCDGSVYVILHRVLVHCNNKLTWQFVVIEIKPSKCCQLPNFSWNIPYKNNNISICDGSVYGYISTKITHLQKITKIKNGTSHPTYKNKNWQKSFWQYCTIRKKIAPCENHIKNAIMQKKDLPLKLQEDRYIFVKYWSSLVHSI